MAVSKKTKQELAVQFGGSATNTGKTEVQIAILTAEISSLTTHLVANKKDKISKRGLYKKVAHRKRLLSYLQRKDINAYRELLKQLNLRG
ncbi:30S ribosomal protein S15 [Ureaplasma zalophigenitalium]|uniref:Small ribosomal subunit protein uS15 n=1 Tax=Ureaplasma zalophigenitalium TaxID=907723 RepID=A0ABT3BNK0_9BACT|nr:30S ribosomal protein S15 [Ureaplasma zalophigenitalium]MCV3753827.1 30S ribosomal protein S15 [Ureaplasma zalophigenitalium]